MGSGSKYQEKKGKGVAQASTQRASHVGSSHKALQEGCRRKKSQLLSWPDPHSPCLLHPPPAPTQPSALLRPLLSWAWGQAAALSPPPNRLGQRQDVH